MNKIKVVIKNISNENIYLCGILIKPNCLSEIWISKDDYESVKLNDKLELFTYVSLEFVNESMNDINKLLEVINLKLKKIEEYIPEYKERV